jgi:hypothetical protein
MWLRNCNLGKHVDAGHPVLHFILYIARFEEGSTDQCSQMALTYSINLDICALKDPTSLIQ